MAKIRHVSRNLFELCPSPPDKAVLNARAEMFFCEGVNAEEAGHAEEAVSFYRQALALNPQMACALVNIGAIACRNGNYAEAEKHFLKAVDANPCYSLARYNFAECLARRGQRVAAVQQYEIALELQPNYADAHFNVALEYYALGEPCKAQYHVGRYLSCAKDDDRCWIGIARELMRRLQSQGLQVVAKPVATHQAEPDDADSQVG